MKEENKIESSEINIQGNEIGDKQVDILKKEIIEENNEKMEAKFEDKIKEEENEKEIEK